MSYNTFFKIGFGFPVINPPELLSDLWNFEKYVTVKYPSLCVCYAGDCRGDLITFFVFMRNSVVTDDYNSYIPLKNLSKKSVSSARELIECMNEFNVKESLDYYAITGIQ